MKNGKFNKQEMATLRKAVDILSKWDDWTEESGEDEGYAYDNGAAALAALAEFVYVCQEADNQN